MTIVNDVNNKMESLGIKCKVLLVAPKKAMLGNILFSLPLNYPVLSSRYFLLVMLDFAILARTHEYLCNSQMTAKMDG